MDKLEPCPYCGKKPKIRLGGYGFGNYPYCEVFCKPFFRKGHMRVTHFVLPYGTVDVAKEGAIKLWNDKAKNGLSHQKRSEGK